MLFFPKLTEKIVDALELFVQRDCLHVLSPGNEFLKWIEMNSWIVYVIVQINKLLLVFCFSNYTLHKILSSLYKICNIQFKNKLIPLFLRTEMLLTIDF